jgi:hypothetical protein
VNFIERVMRVMTHINIGVALGLAAWVVWSGWQLVTGQIAPAYSAAEFRALVSLAPDRHAVRMDLVPTQPQGGAQPPCHAPLPVAHPTDGAPTGADL